VNYGPPAPHSHPLAPPGYCPGPAAPYSGVDGANELQAAVDDAVGADTHVLVIHTWAHETEALCRDQFLRTLQARLDALAL